MNKIFISFFVVIFLFASIHSQELAHKDGKSKHIYIACSTVEHNHSSKHNVDEHYHEGSIMLHSHFKNHPWHDHKHSDDHYHYVEANQTRHRIRTVGWNIQTIIRKLNRDDIGLTNKTYRIFKQPRLILPPQNPYIIFLATDLPPPIHLI